MKSRVASLTCLLAFLFVKGAYAYKTDTHKAVSVKAAALSERYKQFLNEFSQDSEAAFELTGFGSVAEDDDPRYLKHFYDPVNEVGLSRIVGHFEAAISWGYQSPDNLYSWMKARNYMYQALTGTTRSVQDENYKNLYRALGQIIHLVEDMAQPSHVRNDPHVSHSENIFGAFAFNPSHLEDWAQSHGGQVAAIINAATGPQPTVSFNSTFITLALLSNRNFFSDDTIFKNYPQPSKEETNDTDSFLQFGISGEPAQVLAEDRQIYEVPYIIKTRGAFVGSKLAQVGYFGDLLLSFPDEIRYLAFQIDDVVAKGNAQILIPQAISYSAGLLNYFFRGEMDAQPDGADGIKITNKSSENMDGTFALFYDTIDGERRQVTNASWPLQIASGTQSQTQTFIAPTDAKEAGKYILVFKGRLGLEEGAVVGKAIAACDGLCENWEGASAHYFTNQLDFPHFESGSSSFQTKNGQAVINCGGFSFQGTVDIKQGIGSNDTNALAVYIKAQARFSNNSQCDVTLTLRQPLPLAKYHRVRLDFFVSRPELLSFHPLATLGPQINFFVVYFDQPIVQSGDQFKLTYTPEHTTSLALQGSDSWETFEADIFDRLGLTTEQISGVKIVKILMAGRFNFQDGFGSTAARTFAWDNIQIFGDQ